MEIRLASELQIDSVVDGLGIRTVLWTQGCSHNCLGCHNPCTHDFNGGFLRDIESVKEDIACLEFQDGITFSGGDPFFQAEQCAILAEYTKSLGMDVWCYTGFTFEKLLEMSKSNLCIINFLENIDVLVDGKFELEKRDLSLEFRGSSNQRIIDVKKSLKENKVIELELNKEEDINFGRSNNYVFV